MNKRTHPVINLTKQLLKNSAFSFKNAPRIAVFYLKLMLQEPFRWVEKKNHRTSIRHHTPQEDPVFIIGHWRSGTSFMQYLLGCDPQFGYLNKFQAVFPDVFLQSEERLKSLARRIPETLGLVRDAQNMSINLEWDSPSEVEIALTTMMSPASPHWGHLFPRESTDYLDKYLFFDDTTPAEINQWKTDYAHLIDKVSLKNEGRQLLVKSPGNTSRIKQLLEMYPHARFIFLHRNPYDTFYSSQKLWHTLIDHLALQDFSQIQIEIEIVRIYKKLMRQYLEQRARLPAHQLIEVRFNDFIHQPVEQLRTIYKQLNMDDFTGAKPHLRRFLGDKTQGKSSEYAYEDRIIKWLNKEWQFAFDAWNYPMQPVAAQDTNNHLKKVKID